MPTTRHAMFGVVLGAAVAAAAAASCEPGVPTEQSRPPTALVATQSAAPDVPAPLNFVAHLTGASEVPARETPAVGEVKFQLSPDGTQLEYRLISSNITNVFVSHIHLGAADVAGPVTVFLFGPVAPGGGRSDGVLAHGTITVADLKGPLAGHPFSDLIAAMKAGGTYVNVHTNDGVDGTNTGPGDFPGGEIRGQIRPLGPTP
jgi:hypothetical protein